jgi:hypothetical protein
MTSYCYSDGGKRGLELEIRKTQDVSEVTKHLRGLIAPKQSLDVIPPGIDGYLVFFVVDDGSITMEIMDRAENDFATVDVSTAECVVKIAMTDARDIPLRHKLGEVAIEWIT